MKRSAEKAQVSLRVPSTTIDALDRIARALDRDRSWVMLEAFSAYLKGEGGHILKEAAGIAELDRGESVDFDEAMDGLEKIIAGAESRDSASKRSA
jgi:predicted transcriptional regulator